MGGKRKALIVANDKYDQEALRDLVAPAADAEALGRVLGDPQIGDFAVQVVRNQPAHIAEAQIEELFADSRPDDVLLLHFSGHGLKSESGELFFAASNTRVDRLGSTAVSADFVQRCMRTSRSRSVVLLLDCCYGGAFGQGVTVRAAGDVNVLDSFPREPSGGGRGRAVITASSSMEYAFEGDQLTDNQNRRPSVFTGALVEGLATGEADRDEDGWISLDELYDYIFDKVREQNPHQTPSRHVELEGELYLARSRRQRIRAAAIPADLRSAMTDQNMYTRLGAVSELRARLTSDNLPAAAGAYQALAELARTDIRYVADPAAAALNDASVRPDHTELHFGRVEQGSAPPHQTIQLLGPPIARVCVPRPSDDWIRVDQTAGQLDISVDTSGTGTMRGSLGLNGPTGEAAIAIAVDLVPTPAHDPPSLRPQPQSDERADREPQHHVPAPPNLDPDSPESDRKRPWLRPLVLLLGVLVLAAIGLICYTALQASPKPSALHTSQNPPAKPVIYSGGKYGFNGPGAIAVVGTHIWVVNPTGDSVTELDASNGSWVRTLSGGSYHFTYPFGIAVSGTHIWVVNGGPPGSGHGWVTELDASNGSWVRTLSGGSYHFSYPSAIAADGTHIWVVNGGAGGSDLGSVTELDASNGSWVRTVSGASYGFDTPQGIADDGTHLWVTNANGNSVTELDTSNGSWVRTLSGGSYHFSDPLAIAAYGNQIWVTNGVFFKSGNSVTELDASNGSWVRTLSGGSYGFDNPLGVAADGVHVWVTNPGTGDQRGGTVTELDASNGSRVGTLSGRSYGFDGPAGIAIDGASIWVANALGNSVTEFPGG